MFGRIMPENKALVVRKSDGSLKVYTEGRAKIMPLTEKLAAVLDLDEQTAFLERQTVMTADGRARLLSALIRYHISSPQVYAENAPERTDAALTSLVLTAAKDLIGAAKPENALDGLGTRLVSVLTQAAASWGITVSEVAVTEFESI